MGIFDMVGRAMFGDARGDMARNAGKRWNPQLQQSLGWMQGQAEGKDSVAQEQLRQALAKNTATEQAMAATGRGGSQALARRQAAQRVGDLRSGLAGQSALAGLMERKQAQSQLAQLLAALRGQDVGLTSALMQQPTPGERMMGLGADVGQAALLSDKRKKTDIRTADREADELLGALKAYRYRYRDPSNGAGEQLGIMAQDLERSKLGRGAVMETERGKMINVPRLAGALAAASARLNDRVAKLEEAK